jgi:hypothetical protein
MMFAAQFFAAVYEKRRRDAVRATPGLMLELFDGAAH